MRLRNQWEGIYFPDQACCGSVPSENARLILADASQAAGGCGVCKLCDGVFPLPKAIESFALMVKQTAQMLQSFGTELAETELPNDVQSTSSVLCAHTEKKVKAKVCAASVGGGGCLMAECEVVG